MLPPVKQYLTVHRRDYILFPSVPVMLIQVCVNKTKEALDKALHGPHYHDPLCLYVSGLDNDMIGMLGTGIREIRFSIRVLGGKFSVNPIFPRRKSSAGSGLWTRAP